MHLTVIFFHCCVSHTQHYYLHRFYCFSEWLLSAETGQGLTCVCLCLLLPLCLKCWRQHKLTVFISHHSTHTHSLSNKNTLNHTSSFPTSLVVWRLWTPQFFLFVLSSESVCLVFCIQIHKTGYVTAPHSYCVAMCCTSFKPSAESIY